MTQKKTATQSVSQDLERAIDALVDEMPVAVYAADGRLESANAKYKALVGAAGSKKNFFDLVAGSELDSPEGAWQSVLEGGMATGTFKSRGAKKAVHLTCCPIRNAKDVTEVAVVAQAAEEATPEANSDDGYLAAIQRSQAVIEFDLEGRIVSANENFLGAVGYELDEIVGQHHRMFCEPEYAQSAEYEEFWAALNRGEFLEGQFRRQAKGGRELWLQATYNPLLDANGQPRGVVKFASDITEQRNRNAEYEGKVGAISRSQAVIEFDLSGHIVSANENFLGATGYELDEIVGQHHRMFCEPSYAESAEYREFWAALNRGEFLEGQFERRAKGGRELWLQATYNPLFDANGKPRGVVKFASDITEQRNRNADYECKVGAISRSQAVIEFDLSGHIVSANENFLGATGYELDEIVGQHHRMFCEPSYADSTEYRDFWAALNRGEFLSGQFKRQAKGGKELWLQATYNPLFDASGKPRGVVKFASDITEQRQRSAEFEGKIDAISRSQAVIEFDLSGHILSANENFLGATGYELDEIVGQHHRMFCEPDYAESPSYREFWAALNRGEFLQGEFKRRAKGGASSGSTRPTTRSSIRRGGR